MKIIVGSHIVAMKLYKLQSKHLLPYLSDENYLTYSRTSCVYNSKIMSNHIKQNERTIQQKKKQRNIAFKLELSFSYIQKYEKK